MPPARPDVFEYDHYRPFVADMVGCLRATERGFSFRNVARRAGFKSPNFVKLVMDGQRNLSGASAHNIAQGLGLSPAETRYLEALVRFNHVRTESERAWRYAELCAARMGGGLHTLAPAQFDYYSRWYAVAIRELAALPGFRSDPVWIGARLRPPIAPGDVGEALGLLVRLGLLADQDGRPVPTEPDVSTTPEVSGTVVREFHRTMIRQALVALDELPSSRRHISSVTLPLDRDQVAALKERIELWWEEVVAMASTGPQNDRGTEVFQLNIQLFPLTQTSEEEP